MLQNLEDTIIALSTPSGSSLRTILRISGPDALSCISNIFVKELPEDYYLSKKKDRLTDDFRLFYDNTVDVVPNRSINGYLFAKKEAVYIPSTLYIMKSPHSFTKEDIVEIHTIGSIPIIEMILSEILFNTDSSISAYQNKKHTSNKHLPNNQGSSETLNNKRSAKIRLAEPGEFTKRAFLNGRIDLTQAEAVLKIIRSKSDKELLASNSLLKGEIQDVINVLRDKLIELCSKIEATIDFSDQDISLISHEEIEDSLCSIQEELTNLISEKNSKKKLNTEGINIVLLGKPNVGKSSLLNAFDPGIHTIVSHLPHTTRDSIKRIININNIRFNFFDNPGIDIDVSIENLVDENNDANSNNINFKAISKSRESLEYADIVLFVVDGSAGLNDIDKSLFGKIKNKNKIIVINKDDLTMKVDLNELSCESKTLSIVKTSAINRKGIDILKKELVNKVLNGHIDQSNPQIVTNTRHAIALKGASDFIDYALETTKNRESFEFIALDLRNAFDVLGEIIGNVVTNDILDKIFEDFCIGK